MSDTPKLLALMVAARDLPALDYSKQLEVLVRELETEIAALRAELAPLRETVGVRGDSKTCRDDINYWSKLVERSDFAIRLERENAALRAELKRQRALWQATHALGLAEREFAIKCIETALRKEAQP